MRNTQEALAARSFAPFSNDILPHEAAARLDVPRTRSGSFTPLTVGPLAAANATIEAASAVTPAGAEPALHLTDGAEYFFVSYAREPSPPDDTDFGMPDDDDEVGWF